MQYLARANTNLLVVLLLGLEVMPYAWSGESFVYMGEAGQAQKIVRFVVTEDGLSSIQAGEREIAKGGWFARDASWLYGQQTTNDSPPKGELEIMAENRVRVRHVGPCLTTTFVYEFNGEDVRIHARVENFGDTTIKAVGFSGLNFNFAREPEGYFHTHDRSFMERMAKMDQLFHPCWWHQLGGSYLSDGKIGIGLAPNYRQLTKTLFWWDGRKNLHYLVGQSIPPDGALAFDMVLRVSANDLTWEHLLEPYRQHFRKTFGPVRYNADHHPIGGVSLAHSSHVTADNPYGYSWWRLDKPGGGEKVRGMTEFADQTAESIKRAKGQGIIAWCVTGWNPRGMNFRPDFDVIPPEVEENLAIWRQIYDRGGLKMGALARPAEFPTPITWNQDGRVWLTAEDPPILHDAQSIPPIQVMINRFLNMKERGFSLFYLDVFGVTHADAKAMRHFRNQLGPNVLTFAEFWTDVVLVDSGAYLHVRWNEKQGQYQDTWRRDHLWEIMHWLIPGVQGLSACAPPNETPKDGDNAPPRYLYEHGVTPMFWQGTSSTMPLADALRPLVDEFVNDDGSWK